MRVLAENGVEPDVFELVLFNLALAEPKELEVVLELKTELGVAVLKELVPATVELRAEVVALGVKLEPV